MDYTGLINAAIEARKKSYSPYSHFSVGAAVLCEDGDIYCGANIENGSYGATICAERTAIFRAVYDGKREFKAIVIVGDKAENETIGMFAYPCGICRQVMTEFFDKNTRVIIAKNVNEYEEYFFEEIMPAAFSL